MDDDDDGTDDEADEINAPNSDDFRTLFGKDVAQANIIDLLRYRVWKQVRMEIMEANGWDEAALIGLNDNEYRDDLLVPASQLAEARITGETYVDTNGSGMYDAARHIPSGERREQQRHLRSADGPGSRAGDLRRNAHGSEPSVWRRPGQRYESGRRDSTTTTTAPSMSRASRATGS